MKKVIKAAKVVGGFIIYPLVVGEKLINTVWSSTVDLVTLPLTSISDTIDTMNKAAEEFKNESAKKED